MTTYTVENHTVLLQFGMPPVLLADRCESNRTFAMMEGLKSKFGDDYIFEIFGGRGDCNHYAPFSGGGDIKVFKAGT